jgi:hypothetical protein
LPNAIFVRLAVGAPFTRLIIEFSSEFTAGLTILPFCAPPPARKDLFFTLSRLIASPWLLVETFIAQLSPLPTTNDQTFRIEALSE